MSDKYSWFKSDLSTVDRGTHSDEIKDCGRCGFTWPKCELIQQDGMLVCPDCYDMPKDYREGD